MFVTKHLFLTRLTSSLLSSRVEFLSNGKQYANACWGLKQALPRVAPPIWHRELLIVHINLKYCQNWTSRLLRSGAVCYSHIDTHPWTFSSSQDLRASFSAIEGAMISQPNHKKGIICISMEYHHLQQWLPYFACCCVHEEYFILVSYLGGMSRNFSIRGCIRFTQFSREIPLGLGRIVRNQKSVCVDTRTVMNLVDKIVFAGRLGPDWAFLLLWPQESERRQCKAYTPHRSSLSWTQFRVASVELAEW